MLIDYFKAIMCLIDKGTLSKITERRDGDDDMVAESYFNMSLNFDVA